MQDPSSENHAAAAWLAGKMDPAQRQQFETHLAGCAQCQAEVAALRAAQAPRHQPAAATKVQSEPERPAAKPRAWQMLLAAVVTLIAGFALGWWAWQMAHH
jgi:anti-sigma factor RsiW